MLARDNDTSKLSEDVRDWRMMALPAFILKRCIIANWRVLNYYDDLAATRSIPGGSNDKGHASLKAFVKRSHRRDLTNRAIFRYRVGDERRRSRRESPLMESEGLQRRAHGFPSLSASFCRS